MKTIDLLEYQNLFLKNLETSGKSFNTVKNYKTDLNIFNHFLTDKKQSLIIKQITNEQMQEYSLYLEKKYNSPNSIRRRVQALRIFFDFLIAKDLYAENPVKKIAVNPKVVDLPKPCEFHIVKNLYTNLQTIQKSASAHEKLLVLRNRVLIQLIYGGCLKVSDIERLKVDHLTISKGQVRILIAPDKRDPFTVAMPSSFTELHQEYLTLIEKRKSVNKVDFIEYLFNGNPFKILKGGLSARGIEVIFKELSKSQKTIITAKNIRQAGIFQLLTSNTPDSRVKELMGVQPQYSLKPYKDLMEKNPEKYCYLDLQ